MSVSIARPCKPHVIPGRSRPWLWKQLRCCNVADVSGPKGGPLLGKNPEKLPREPLEPTDRVHDHLPNFGVHQTLATLANIAKVSKKLDAVNVRCISSCLEGDRMAHACAGDPAAMHKPEKIQKPEAAIA